MAGGESRVEAYAFGDPLSLGHSDLGVVGCGSVGVPADSNPPLLYMLFHTARMRDARS